MFQAYAARLAAAIVMAVLPTAAFAGVYKCVGPDGASSFSDKPCPTAEGQKQAEIKSDSALSNALARNRDQEIGQACTEMTDRMNQCNVFINPTITRHFQDSCYAPQHRYEIEREKRVSRQNDGQPVDWDHDYRYHRMTSAELKCDLLVTDMWQFVKSNFARDLTEQEIKAMDYETQASEVEQPSQPSQPRRSKRSSTVIIIRNQ